MTNKVVFLVSFFRCFSIGDPESGLMHMPISRLLFGRSTSASVRWKANEPGNTCAFTTCR